MPELSVEIYEDRNGKRPFAAWFSSLRDIKTQARVESRLRRLTLGNFGDHKLIGHGIIELRLDFGPGYRVYCSRRGNTIVLLLCGGDKSTQQQDIEKAKAYLADYGERS